ncbi:MAG: hypothetical protein SFV17_05475 [Candidatus Obscuribacter sp.]|nr:hypothetical protein [Candidatus Obscuribacter sp.]
MKKKIWRLLSVATFAAVLTVTAVAGRSQAQEPEKTGGAQSPYLQRLIDSARPGVEAKTETQVPPAHVIEVETPLPLPVPSEPPPPPPASAIGEDGVRALTPDEIVELLQVDTNDQEAFRRLVRRLSIPEKSFIVITPGGAVACPVDSNEFGVNLFFFAIRSSHQDREPSETCREWVQALLDDATLDRIEGYLHLLGRSDRERIIIEMMRYLAAERLGISPAHFDVIMMDLRPMSELTAAEQQARLESQRVRFQQILQRYREEQRQSQEKKQPEDASGSRLDRLNR